MTTGDIKRGHEWGGAREGPMKANSAEKSSAVGGNSHEPTVSKVEGGGPPRSSEPDVWCCTH